MELNPSPSSSQSPPPPPAAQTCPQCSGNLGALQLCGGLGSDIHNYNRWFQKCSNCPRLVFYGPRTPLEDIPEDVQVRFTVNQSLRSAVSTNPQDILTCTGTNCATRGTSQRRRVNKACARHPPLCATCCRSTTPLVRCKAHRLSALETTSWEAQSTAAMPSGGGSVLTVPPSAAPSTALPATPSTTQTAATQSANLSTMLSVTSSAMSSATPFTVSESSMSSTTSAATLSATSSIASSAATTSTSPWVAAHQKKAERAALVDEGRELHTKMANIVKVTMWVTPSRTITAPLRPQRLQVSTPQADILVVTDQACLKTLLPTNTQHIAVYNALEREWFIQPLDLPIALPTGSVGSRRVLIRHAALLDDDCAELAEELTAVTTGGPLKRRSVSVPATPTKVRKFSSTASPHGHPLPALMSTQVIETDHAPALSTETASPQLIPTTSTTTLAVTAAMISSAPAETTPVATTTTTTTAPAATAVATAAATPVLQCASSSASGEQRPMKPIPFPPRYACDMHAGMSSLVDDTCTLADHNKDPQQYFNIAFPGCKYVRATFYEHRRYYCNARADGTLARAVSAGRTPDGLWTTLSRQYRTSGKGLRTGSARQTVVLDESPAQAADNALTSSGYGASGVSSHPGASAQNPPRKAPLTYISHNVRLEWFDGVGTMFGSRWSPSTENIEVSIAEQLWCKGRRKNCHQMTITEPARFMGAYLAKTVRPEVFPVDWEEHYHNLASVQFREAERLARAADIAGMFVYEASEKCPGMRYRAVTWIAQKLLTGTGKSYPPEEGSCQDNALLLTLSAFSHYTINRYDVLFTALEGLYVKTPTVDNDSLVFYSCKTNTKYGEAGVYLDDYGARVINDFARKHSCNAICHSLNLAPIPIDLDIPPSLFDD
ncbi:uncharacterized protein TRAVEDRAFT_66220 [Trametes versicolor FP-101664 SS1]|uniref:uncharacterized protein n=1 Tax=Trametes versicolor (strain FP-101664) TaxID=717944 RepID=UPI000462236F|nr:uncharacterized protein TRAVEDRAFT_66220 [Trametes versicolor FP-101664 SS1]EIW56143.1 hypothetical protein TRAVEDRAFT_66220 [Trametes versicolor FP-101664 SS1]